MLLDGIMASQSSAGARFDSGGAIAAEGRVAEDVVHYFLSEPFFAKKPPKSAGREEFGSGYLSRFLARTERLTLADRLRTAAALTAAGVAKGVEMSGKGVPKEVLVSGGGAKNETLMAEIRARLRGPTVATTESLGVPVDAKEAMAFAFLALSPARAARQRSLRDGRQTRGCPWIDHAAAAATMTRSR